MISGGKQMSWPHSSLFACPPGSRLLGEEAKGHPHLLNVPNPIPDVVEGLLIGNVVDQHDTLREERERGMGFEGLQGRH